MRQSNNALTHLTAQYRAVLKNALVTGSAVFSAFAGLYATNAQAADANAEPNARASDNQTDISGTVDWSVDTDGKIYDSKGAVVPAPQGVHVSPGGKLTFSSKTDSVVEAKLKDGLDVFDSGIVSISNVNLKAAEGSKYTGSISGKKAQISITNGMAIGNSVSITDSSTVNINGGSDVTELAKYAQLGAGDNGSVEVSASTINVNENAQFAAAKDLTLDNTSNVNLSGSTTGKSIVRADSGTMYVKGGSSINVQNGGNGTIAANKAEFTDSSINVGPKGSSLLLEGAINTASESTKANAVAGKASGFKSGDYTFNGKSNINIGDVGKLLIGGAADDAAPEAPNEAASGVNHGLVVTFNDSSSVDVGNGSQMVINSDAGVNFNGAAQLNINNGGNVTINEGADLAFAGNALINNNGGSINVNSGANLELGAKNISGSDYNSALGVEHVHIKNMGKFDNKGTVTVTSGWIEGEKASDFGVNTADHTQSGKVRLENSSMISINSDLDIRSNNLSGDNAVFQNATAGSANAPVVAAKNLTFITADQTASAAAAAEEVPVATESTGGINLVGENLTFQGGQIASDGKNGKATSNSGDSITINGKQYTTLAVNGASPSDLKFTAQKALATTGLDSLKLTNAQLNLDNVTLGNNNTSNNAAVNTNLAISTGAELNVNDFNWTAKDLLVEGGGAVKITGENTHFIANNIDVMNAAAGTGKSLRAATAVDVSKGAELSAMHLNVDSGTTVKVDGTSTLAIRGDGDNSTVDLVGGKNVVINGGNLDLNDIQDTLGAKFTIGTAATEDKPATPGKFEIASGYDAVNVMNGATVKVDLSKILASVTPPATDNPSEDGTTGDNNAAENPSDSGSDNIKVEQLTLAELNSLKSILVNGNGILSVTGAEVDLGIDSNGNLDFSNLAGNSDSAVVSIETEQSKNATITNMRSADKLSGGWKAVKASGNAASIGATANQTLALYGTVGSSKNIIENESGGIVGVNLNENSVLNLTGGNGEAHNIGAISGNQGNLNIVAGNVAIKEMDGNRLADINVKRFGTSNNGGAATVVSVNDVNANVYDTRDAAITAKNITISSGGNLYTKGGSLEANNIDATSATGNFYENISGVADLQFNGKNNYGAIFDGSKVKAANFKGKDVALAGGANVNVGDRFDVENLTVVGDSTLNVGAIRLQYTNNEIHVGDNELNITSRGERNGHIVASKTIDLNGGTLIIDPDYNSKTSTVFTPSFDPYNTTANTQGTTFTGNVIVGQNAALGIGDNEQSFRSALARYQKDSSLNPEQYGAYTYIDKSNIELGDKKLIVGTESIDDLKQIAANNNASIYLGQASALEVTAKAMYGSENGQVFSDFGDKTLASNGGTLVVPSNFNGDVNGDITKIFGKSATFDTTNVSESNPLYITTANGMYIGKITTQDQLQGLEEIKLVVNPDAGDIFAGMSHPVKEFYFTLEGAKAYDSHKAFSDAVANDPTHAYGDNGVAYVSSEAGVQFFMDAAAMPGRRANDMAIRLATLGGATQAAQMVNELGVEAVSARMGNYNSAPDTISYAYQGYNLPQREVRTPGKVEGGNIWVNPSYRSFSSKHIHANDLGYGTDVDLYGASLGYDFTSQSKYMLGAYVNFGRVDGTGKELGEGVSNEGNYLGAGAYFGFSPAPHLDFMFDAAYSRVNNDLTGKLNSSTWDDLTASTNTSLFSAGFKARYAVDLGGFELEPHAGLRVNHLSMDNYDVKSGKDTILNSSSDSLTYVSIPLGIGIKRNIEHNGWEFSPELDLSLTTVLGGLDQNTESHYTGVYGASLHSHNEVLERVTYGAKVGLGVAKDNTSVGVEVGYVGSSKSSDLGISANAAVKF